MVKQETLPEDEFMKRDNPQPENDVNNPPDKPSLNAPANPVGYFGRGSLRAETNQLGTQGRVFQVEPHTASVSSNFQVPFGTERSRHPVQPFFVYDGAHGLTTRNGKIATSISQVLPDKRIEEQDAIEWNRVGAKKGWMFNGPPQENRPGFSGENFPTHTSDGWIESTPKWSPIERSEDKQSLAHREMPSIDVTNRARGIGMSSRGGAGMAGGYQEVTKERLESLPVPMAKYCWTGNRVQGTARTDGTSSGNGGAGGYRSGYASVYPTYPVIPSARRNGVSKRLGSVR